MIEDVRIIRRGGCILASSPISTSILVTLANELPAGAVMDPDAARIANVGFAMGMPDDIKQLKEELADQARRDVRRRMEGRGLSEGALEWLAVGAQGLSSLALFHTALGTAPSGTGSAKYGQQYPRDPSDLNRIVNMLKMAPEVREKLDEMRDLSPEWEAIVDHFDELEGMLTRELSENSERRDSETYSKMKAILAAAREEHRHAGPAT